MLIQDIKNLKRFNDIVFILTKYGFDEIVDRFDVPQPALMKKIHKVPEDITIYQRIRMILEELGPTYIKFGQIMSLRPDLLPRELLDELSILQDNVSAISFNRIEEVINESLSPPLNKHFATFHTEPLAAASLSQVHLGSIKDSDEEVVIKVQRPGIKEKMLSDLDILESIADFLDQQFDDLKSYDLPEVIKTVRRHLLDELDFEREMDNMNIARSYNDSDKVYIPRVYQELSSKKVLVMEHVQGTKFKDVEGLPEQRRQAIAKNGLYAATKQILGDGFFHADPHPGNLIIKEDDQVCFIDWGMVGRLTDQDKVILLEMLSAIVEKDSESLTKLFLRLCDNKHSDVDKSGLERAILELLERYHSLPLAEMNIAEVLTGLLSTLHRFNLRLPIEYVIMIKTLITAEGAARLAYPNFNVIEEVKGQVKSLSRARYRPDKLWQNLKRSFSTALAVKKELPQQLLNIIDMLEQGEFGVNFRLEKLDHLVRSLESASNRLTIGIITGSIIIGSSMIITTGVGPFLFGYPALGVLGYILSVVLGMWLVFTILRHKKY